MSAGSQPTGQVYPRSLALLEREGISTKGLFSKSWDNLPAVLEVVITVCGNAAGETCPTYLGSTLPTHWGVDDPANATGIEEEINAAFKQACRILRRRIEALLAMPLDDLRQDFPFFKMKLDHIGTLES